MKLTLQVPQPAQLGSTHLIEIVWLMFFKIYSLHLFISHFPVIFLRFGRRYAAMSSLLGLFLCGMGTAFSPNIYVYMILKFFCGVTGVLVMQATVIGKFMTPQISTQYRNLWLPTASLQTSLWLMLN